MPTVDTGGIPDVRLHKINMQDRRSLSAAAVALLGFPEVREKIRLLGLEEVYEDPSGFYKLRPPKPIALSDMTVRQVLNTLAAHDGKANWIYIEESCAGKRKFRLRFNKRQS
jgi:hypothetical protein